MSDWCISCGEDIDEATYIPTLNAWMCPHCKELNPNYNGSPTIPDIFLTEYAGLKKALNTSSSNDAQGSRTGNQTPVAPQDKEGQSLSSPKMISRFELILDGKRFKVVWPCTFDYSVQDSGRTLKCFVKSVKDKDSFVEFDKRVCNHCGGKVAIRNPSGGCDHLYYPENCQVCSKTKADKRYS